MCTGRDEQRLKGVRGHTYVVFPDRATADAAMREIAATPIVATGLGWPVEMWDDDADTAIGTMEASDGRVAVGHHWTKPERRWLTKYVGRWRNVKVLDALPTDWRPKEFDDNGLAAAQQALAAAQQALAAAQQVLAAR